MVRVGFGRLPGQAGRTLSSLIRGRVERTINRLGLNDRECQNSRRNYVIEYETMEMPLEHLTTRAPFIVMELRRQGRLKEGDT